MRLVAGAVPASRALRDQREDVFSAISGFLLFVLVKAVVCPKLSLYVTSPHAKSDKASGRDFSPLAGPVVAETGGHGLSSGSSSRHLPGVGVGCPSPSSSVLLPPLPISLARLRNTGCLFMPSSNKGTVTPIFLTWTRLLGDEVLRPHVPAVA